MTDVHSLSAPHALGLSAPLVVGLGESLYDCFTDREVLGGAPINVAIHSHSLLQTIGGQAATATRVGDDELGRRFLREIGERGLPTDVVQVDPVRPTGRVDVSLDEAGHASYEFASGVAWDALEFDDMFRQLAESCAAVCFGTLAQRSEQSRKAIFEFVNTARQSLRLFDVNLRGDFFSAPIIDSSLRAATAVKLNEEELPMVCGMLQIADPNTTDADTQAERLMQARALDWLALTRGKHGTAIYAGGSKYTSEPVSYPAQSDADTVGAGDACCAGLLFGRLQDWGWDRTLNLANHLGAFVASQHGATPTLPESLLKLAKSS